MPPSSPLEPPLSFSAHKSPGSKPHPHSNTSSDRVLDRRKAPPSSILTSLPSNLQSSLEEAMDAIFTQGRQADRVIEATLRTRRKWGARDRRFFAEVTYDIVRWWRALELLTQKQETVKGKRGLTQNPHYSEIFETYLEQGPFPLDLAQNSSISPRLKRILTYSIPDWLDLRGQKELPNLWDQALTYLNQPAPVDLRTNTLKTSPQELILALQEEGIEVRSIPPPLPPPTSTDIPISNFPSSSCPPIEALTLPQRKNVFQTEAFKKGWFEVQDRSSQRVGHFLNPQPGEWVIDACAGAGGKSLHLAALMKNQGRIIALDIHEYKLKELRQRARRAGVDIIETRWISSAKIIKRLEAKADRVLLDVPCSGLGVLRRNPDTKWKLTEDRLEELQRTQISILHNYSKMVRPGGSIVYSTCSLLPSENEQIIRTFLDDSAPSPKQGSWKLLSEWRSFPEPRGQGGDLFYLAHLLRTS